MSSIFTPQPRSLLWLPPDYEMGTFVVSAQPRTLSAESWDELRLSVWGVFPELACPDDFISENPLGTPMADIIELFEGLAVGANSAWFLQGANLKAEDSERVITGELTFLGCADMDRPYKLTMDAEASEYEAKNVIVSDGITTFGPYPKMRTVEPEISMTVAYPVFGLAPASGGLTPNPPYLPALRAYWWASSDPEQVTQNWPNGWWKTRMPVETLIGVSPNVAHFVVDHWKYTYEARIG